MSACAHSPRGNAVELTLDDGRKIEIKPCHRRRQPFSETRRMRGIAASMRFRRTMMVCRMALERDHEGIAWGGSTTDRRWRCCRLNGNEASVVLTLPAAGDRTGHGARMKSHSTPR